MNLQDMKNAQKAAIEKANALVTACETAGRALNANEEQEYNAAMADFEAMGKTIRAREQQTTIAAAFQSNQPVIERSQRNGVSMFRREAWRTEVYLNDFASFVQSGGKVAGEHMHLGFDEAGRGYKVPGLRSANYEGGSTSGAPIVPVVIDQQIVPLAPPVYGIESIASVIPTTMDMKFPRKTAHGTAALKAEGTGDGTHVFGGASPTNDQYTLSAYMVGHTEDISWELMQDVPAFLSFLQDDILLSIATKKAGYFATGSGSSQPQGIKGNVAAGVTGLVADGNGNLLPLVSVLDLVGTLNPVYRNNARFVMQISTGINLRKQQLADNIFNQVFVTVNGQDYLFGYPITYDNGVDAIAAAAQPLYFGDFKSGYQIGIRGGAGVNVKFLDQPKAEEGLLSVLGYQRVDGRVRRSEAIQSLTLHA